jgi:hypothetical protein
MSAENRGGKDASVVVELENLKEAPISSFAAGQHRRPNHLQATMARQREEAQHQEPAPPERNPLIERGLADEATLVAPPPWRLDRDRFRQLIDAAE